MRRLDTKANRLISEKSPYLLQHSHNPVDWYPWGPEAFKKAKEEDKPIFLSIGYSACHWCHVMEKESFEDEIVAHFLNETFVCIKVDREERPDLDAVYMKVCQALTGTGGWPLHIIMTADKRPFFAATYIPKESGFGQVGLIELVPRIQALWISRRNELLDSAEKIVDLLREPGTEQRQASHAEELGESTLHGAYDQLSKQFDEENGGFGSAPKFPSAHYLAFLLRYWKRTHIQKALGMVEKTLEAMRLGGVYDHVGFGFHRYSTDSRWRVPHFEKMLYDQAMLTMAYTEAYQITGNTEFKETAREIISYVLRNMTDGKGAFYTAEDADSEGEEGKFYLWTEQEIKRLLTKEEADLAVKIFNVTATGNFKETSNTERKENNVLYQEKSLIEIASDLRTSRDELQKRVDSIRNKLFVDRESRVHPSKDDKILADWNGLMIAALAKAARAFDQPEYVESAKRAVDFVLEKMCNAENGLQHRYRDGKTNIAGFLDDYAFLTWGLAEIYESSFDEKYLKRAVELTEKALKNFWDDDRSGFFFTGQDSEFTLVREKTAYDSAYPSGNSVAALNLVRLSRLTGQPSFEDKAGQLMRSFSASASRNPLAFAELMIVLDFLIGPSSEVTIVGDPVESQTQKMIKAIGGRFLPRVTVAFVPMKDASVTQGAVDFDGRFIGLKGKATAYVCRNKVCSLPITDVETVVEMLEA